MRSVDPLPSCKLVPSEPSLSTAPTARKKFAPAKHGTDLINSPGLSEDGWAPIIAEPVDADSTKAAAAPLRPEQLWSPTYEIGSEGGNFMHACIFSSLPAGSSPQKHMKKYCFLRKQRHVATDQYLTDQATGECKTQ